MREERLLHLNEIALLIALGKLRGKAFIQLVGRLQARVIKAISFLAQGWL